MKFDLHVHSNYSDGSCSPQELLAQAKTKGLSAIAITDHDTVAGALDVLQCTDPVGVKLIPGVEISSHLDRFPVHILAYGCDWTNKPLHNFLERQLAKRVSRMRSFVQKLKAFGHEVDVCRLLEQAQNQKSVGRLHLALELVRTKVAVDLRTAFEQWIGSGAKAYVPQEYLAPKEVIELIHRAGGIAILAHPQLLPFHWLRRKLLHLAWDGLEGYYGVWGAARAQRWVEICAQRKWLITGGSDYHGIYKPNISLGSSYIQNEDAEQFLKKLRM